METSRGGAGTGTGKPELLKRFKSVAHEVRWPIGQVGHARSLAEVPLMMGARNHGVNPSRPPPSSREMTAVGGIDRVSPSRFTATETGTDHCSITPADRHPTS